MEIKKKRLDYVDAIKGFAILLVIMGHVIPCAYSDFTTYHQNDLYHEHVLWKLIYSFHMPLFMFCSGLFMPIFTKQTAFKEFCDNIRKRFKTLVIPYFFSGILLLVIAKNPDFYWFIVFLFMFIVINTTIDCFISKLGLSKHLSVVGYIIVVAVIQVMCTRYIQYERKPFFDIEHWMYYRFFAFGTICMRYKLLEKLLSKNYIYTISLAGFVTLFICGYFYNIIIPQTSTLKPILAIFAVFYIFRNRIKIEWKISKFFRFLGKRSLELYIFHFFFLVKIPFLGEHLLVKLREMGGVIGSFVGSLLWSIIGSAIVISLSLLAIDIIKCSRILSPLLLGREGYTSDDN